MDHFTYRNGILHADSVALPRLAERFGTPLYVYCKATLDRHCGEMRRAFEALGHPTLPCYAVKANGNLSVLRAIFAHGFGADVVSVGEMERALVAGVEPGKIVFSGVGKQDTELARGCEAGILCFNVESVDELHRLDRVAARLGKKAPVSLRINPNIDAKTHPHISTGLYSTKFGIAETSLGEALEVVRAKKNLRLIGIDCHIGSQITELGPFEEAARRMASIATQLQGDGFALELINLGGGLGIRYTDETPPSLADYARTLVDEVKATGLKLVLEPGRVLVGNSGGLLTHVIGTKQTREKNFLIIDAAMNDLIRPSLYDAYHDIVAVLEPQGATPKRTWDVVGPVCETGDFLGKDRQLPEALGAGDLLLVRSAGAYGFAMSSHYNTRPRAAEVLVFESEAKLVRPREALESLWALELEALKETP